MSRWKLSDGVVFTAAGWLLSGWSLLGAVGIVMGGISGRGETPDFVFIGLWVIMLFGAALSYLGGYLLHKRLVLAFPAACGISAFVLLYVAMPYLVCAYNPCIPAG